MSRFTDELSDREAASIALGVTLLMLDSATGIFSGQPAPPERMRGVVDDIEAIFADLGERFDIPPLNAELIAQTRWRLDNLAEGQARKETDA